MSVWMVRKSVMSVNERDMRRPERERESESLGGRSGRERRDGGCEDGGESTGEREDDGGARRGAMAEGIEG